MTPRGRSMLDKGAQNMRNRGIKVRNLTNVNCAMSLKVRNSRLKGAQKVRKINVFRAVSLSLPIRERDTAMPIDTLGQVV